jgi:hypothetical protein
MGDRLDNLQLHCPLSKQAHAPAGMSLWWFAASQRYDMGLLLASYLYGPTAAGAFSKGHQKALFHKALADAAHCGMSHINHLGNLAVIKAFIGFEQYHGTL